MSRWRAATDQWITSNLEARGTLAVTDEEREQEDRDFLSSRPECSATCIFQSSYFLRNLDRLGLAYRSTANFSSIFLSGHGRTIRHPPKESSVVVSEDERGSLAGQVYAEIDARHQTRLIKLLPGAFNEQIACDLVIHQYTDVSREYEALSYTWGKPLFTVAIKCSGIDYYVTQNLSDALRFMRHTDAPRWLWIDAICINQFDSHEVGRNTVLYVQLCQHIEGKNR